MVYKTLRNKKAKPSIAKILTSAETDDYHFMSRSELRMGRAGLRKVSPCAIER